jgi:uncharacterized membrane protein
MRFFTEKNYRRLFEWTVILKTIIAGGEILLGILLYLVSTATLNNIIYSFLGGELGEVPRDTIWSVLLRGFEGLSGGSQSFWAFIFLTHGLAKLALLVGLLKHKLWAYPASAGVFTLLAIYQIYSLTLGSDFLLLLITILDVVVIILVLHEYRHKRKNYSN